MTFSNPDLGWSRYRDMNPVPAIPFTDDLATAPSGPVLLIHFFLIQLFSMPI